MQNGYAPLDSGLLVPAANLPLAAPTIGLGTAAAAGAATTIIRSDATILAFDATAPTTSAVGDAAAVGAAVVAARRDHAHGREAFAAPTIALGTAAAAGAATTHIRSDATIVAFDATVPTSSALGDAAAAGSAAVAARRDHLHGRSTASKSLFLRAEDATLDSGTLATIGTAPDAVRVVALADAATQGAFWSFLTPSDWVSGALTIIPLWVPGSTDGTAHTVRWSVDSKQRIATQDVTAAGTTTAFTGTSSAQTVNQLFSDASQSIITPSAANTLVLLNLRRVGADGADTYVGVVNLVGVRINYTANS